MIPLKDFDKKYKITPTKAVLIVAEFRTGSTFFSEMFNNHPEITYLYEPLRILRDHCTNNFTIHQNKMKILREYLHECKLPWAENYLSREELDELPSNLRAVMNVCMQHGLCNRGHSRKFIGSEFCPGIKEESEDLLQLFRERTGLDPSQVLLKKRRKKRSDENDSVDNFHKCGSVSK